MVISKPVLMGIQVRIYPTGSQKSLLNQLFGNDRFVWNQLLNMLQERYQNNHTLKLPSVYDLNMLLKPFKNEYPFLKFSDSSSLQLVTEKLIRTYLNFFKKPHLFGKPRFHSKNRIKPSYVGKSKAHVLANHYIKLPKLGVMKCRGLNQLQLNDQIKRYELTRRPNGQFYLSLQVEREKQALPKTGLQVGIDLGLHDLAILSDWSKAPYPKMDFSKLESMAKKWQSKASRRCHQAQEQVARHNHNNKKFHILNDDWEINDFTNWQRAQVSRTTWSRKLMNKRRDKLQKITTQIVKSYDAIVIEDLKSKNMMKNHKVAHAIANHAWYAFRQMLAYKCAWYDKQLIIINPRDTSRICSKCHQKNHQFDGLTADEWLNVREWDCPNCQIHLDRDKNAALNILQRGLATL